MSPMDHPAHRQETARPTALNHGPKHHRPSLKAMAGPLLSREELKAIVAACVD